MPLFNPPPPSTVTLPRATAVTRTTIEPPTAATIATARELAPANPARRSITLINNSTGTVYLDYGAAPTPTVHAAYMAPGGYFEVPGDPTVQIQGLWSAVGGTGVNVREFT